MRVAPVVILLIAVGVVCTVPASARATCVTQGRKWLAYDAHGGTNPKLTATGTTYSVNLTDVTCAYAKAALAKMFPRMRRPPYGVTLTLTGGPAGFRCRSQPGNRPDVGFGGLCANLATFKAFTWMPFDPNAGR